MNNTKAIFDYRQDNLPCAVIVVGPTCSGKSFLSIKIAQALNGTIINADAMQCYRDLRIITTRPTIEDELLVPHYLYGILPWDQTGNARWWREQAVDQLNQAWARGELPILCGGTGMYFHSLIHGIALIPEPDQEARNEARERIDTEGAVALHVALSQVDPETASTLNPSDSQRVARAWEVWKSTGKGLKYWQKEAHIPGISCRFVVIHLASQRQILKEAAAHRFHHMIDAGALDEVKTFLAANPPIQAPLRRALGVPEFAAYLEGKISIDEAIAQAVTNTQRYIKRQQTWFANKVLSSPDRVCTINSRIDNNLKHSESFIDESILFINSHIDV